MAPHQKKFALSLFIFRRDLRLDDNTGLLAALRESSQVIPCFILDDRQINAKKNAYFSENAFHFMIDSLLDLQNQISKKTKNKGKLYIFNGIAENVVEKLLTQLPIDAVYFNRDYTPFSVHRDQKIKSLVEKAKRVCFMYSDALLHEPEEIAKSNGKPYTIFTPFMRRAREVGRGHDIKPIACKDHHFYSAPIAGSVEQHVRLFDSALCYPGGREAGKKAILAISHLTQYDKLRDFPAKNATSHLSAHHKFGTVSIRETAHAIQTQLKNSVLMNELYWRDFFTHIGFHFPHVFGSAFQERYQHIAWSTREDHFKAWCDGKTGFPIVDAGMRELNETGLMHNRVRMITASFLVKDLQIDWRWGERYFANHLMDYDPAVNNGNWQWAASTGCDAQPYFRIFNPLLQQKRFDPAGEYIQQWVTEWKTARYPKPIVDHAISANHAKMLFKQYN